ncbi:MAG: prolipoprotein diacylglyceryl transferase [Ignavibacteria bacterium]|nr:prolipoprotein diacylglyceryl transferase [Ignavibacteria bacterium]
MMPELFRIGPLPVYSFGFMLAVSIIIANYILSKEFKRSNIPEDSASVITLLSVLLGIAGSKLFYLFEDWDNFLIHPVSVIFNPGGLTFFGGFILASLGIYIYARIIKVPFLRIADLTSPSLALAYGIGRIGCHLAGDGDYGIPSSLPWACNYEKGVVPPSYMFRGSEIAKAFPHGVVPDNTPLHPTPIYEFLGAVVIFAILWKLRKKLSQNGAIFSVYLILTGVARLLVEFLRLNQKLMFGLTEAQLISAACIAAGIFGLYKLDLLTKK